MAWSKVDPNSIVVERTTYLGKPYYTVKDYNGRSYGGLMESEARAIQARDRRRKWVKAQNTKVSNGR